MTRRLCAALKGIFVPGVVLKIFVRGVERKDNPQLVRRPCAPHWTWTRLCPIVQQKRRIVAQRVVLLFAILGIILNWDNTYPWRRWGWLLGFIVNQRDAPTVLHVASLCYCCWPEYQHKFCDHQHFMVMLMSSASVDWIDLNDTAQTSHRWTYCWPWKTMKPTKNRK